MSTQGYIHGGSDEREVARLEKQARWGAPFMLAAFDAAPGMRVLDLATGVGAMAGELKQRWPKTRLMGVDLSPTQLRAARANHPDVPVTRGDATALPFKDGAFDRVHCSWLLEHVPSPVPVLREVRRVLAVGGRCHFVEVDNATFGMAPESAAVRETLEALNRAQQAAGGDPYVGRRLGALFHEAGFTEVTVSALAIDGDDAHPQMRQGFAEEFAEIFEGLDESLPQLVEVAHRAAADLRRLAVRPGARLWYRAALGQAVKTL